MKKLLHEVKIFLSYPRDMRVLLITNLIYGFVMPVIEIFVSAYVMRNSNDVKMVVAYQLAVYTAIPFAFFVNGLLMKQVRMTHLYSVGMILSGVSMTLMMSLKTLHLSGIVEAGLVMGMSFGLYWSNRDFLALSSTKDSNRNYYYGLENFFSTNISIIVPIAVGSFIAEWSRHSWLGGRINTAYQIVTIAVVMLTIGASVAIQKGTFQNPPRTRFIFLRFHPLWMKLQGVAVLRGLTSGYIVTAPSMLLMRLVGKEGSIGFVQSGGAILSAIIIYIIGRRSGPQHRMFLFAFGLALFFAGTLPNAILFNSIGVMIFVACLLLSRPLQDIAYFTMQMLVIDTVSRIENRNPFAYILNQEIGYFMGRASGCILFIIFAYKISDSFALRYALPIVAIIQLAAVYLARTILNDKSILLTSSNENKATPVFAGDTLTDIPAEAAAATFNRGWL